MINYEERYTALNGCFKQRTDIHINETNIDVRFFPFISQGCIGMNETLVTDRTIGENFSFDYPVFIPSGKTKNGTRRSRYRE